MFGCGEHQTHHPFCAFFMQKRNCGHFAIDGDRRLLLKPFHPSDNKPHPSAPEGLGEQQAPGVDAHIDDGGF